MFVIKRIKKTQTFINFYFISFNIHFLDWADSLQKRADIIKNALRKLISQALRNEINELMFGFAIGT